MRYCYIVFLLVSCFQTSLHAQKSDFSNTNFGKADSIAALYPDHSLADLRILSNKLTQTLISPEEKFRAIYKWICINIENDYDLYLQITRLRSKARGEKDGKAVNRKLQRRLVHQLVQNKRTMCTGYAHLLRELSLHAGLQCVVIDGYGRTAESNIGGTGIANHSWNAIKLYNKWYLCDATWSSGAVSHQLQMFIPMFNEAYFLSEPSLFVRNHYPLDTAWMLLDSKPTLPQFLDRPIAYTAVYDYNIIDTYPDQFHITADRGERVPFHFVSYGKKIEKTELQVKRLNRTDSVPGTLTNQRDGHYTLEHVFLSSGKHIVHVLIDSKFALTYSVDVK